MQSRVSHVITLPFVIQVMCIGYRKSKASVTRSLPFYDCSNQFVYRPKIIKLNNSCQVHAFKNNLRTYFGQVSSRFQLLLLEIMVVPSKRWVPNPSTTSWNVTKHWSNDIILRIPTVSLSLITCMSSGSSSNLGLWLRNKFPCTSTLVESGFVKLDTT